MTPAPDKSNEQPFDYRKHMHRRPDIMGGERVFVGTRIPVVMIAEALQAGDTVESLMGHFPSLTPDHMRAAQEYILHRIARLARKKRRNKQ